MSRFYILHLVSRPTAEAVRSGAELLHLVVARRLPLTGALCLLLLALALASRISSQFYTEKKASAGRPT